MYFLLLTLFLSSFQPLVTSIPTPEPGSRGAKIADALTLTKDPAETAYNALDNPKGWSGNPKGVWGDYHNMWAADNEFTFSITGIRTTGRPHGYVSTTHNNF